MNIKILYFGKALEAKHEIDKILTNWERNYFMKKSTQKIDFGRLGDKNFATELFITKKHKQKPFTHT